MEAEVGDQMVDGMGMTVQQDGYKFTIHIRKHVTRLLPLSTPSRRILWDSMQSADAMITGPVSRVLKYMPLTCVPEHQVYEAQCYTGLLRQHHWQAVDAYIRTQLLAATV